MASSSRPECCLGLILACFLLWCPGHNQVATQNADTVRSSAETPVEVILHLASQLRNNMVHAIGTILQHRETEGQLTWEQTTTVRRLHDSLISREISIVNMLPQAQKIIKNNKFSTPEQQTILFLNLLSQNECRTIRWDKYVSLLEAYSIGSELKDLTKSLANIEPSKLVHTVRSDRDKFFNSILASVKLHHAYLTPSLLAGILDNFLLPCTLPETREALNEVSKIVLREKDALMNLLPRIEIRSEDSFNDYLTNVLQFLGSAESPFQASDWLKIRIISPFLKPKLCRNLNPEMQPFHKQFHELFLAFKDDDCPQDVVNARNIIMSGTESGKLDFSRYLNNFVPEEYGNDHLSILYAYLSRLSLSLPNVHPASAYVRALLSHAKMKYITSKGGTFVPTTPLDIALLLDSFNTLGIDLTETNTEIYRAFQSESIWKVILKNFPYRHYSQPRTLLIAMLNKILNSEEKIQLCHKIVIKYFLDKVKNSMNDCQNQQSTVSQNDFSVFQNCTAKCLNSNVPMISLPLNLLNETQPSESLVLGDIYALVAKEEEEEENSEETSVKSVSLTTEATTPDVFNDYEKLVNTQCSTNSNLDETFKSAMKIILKDIKINRNGTFPIDIQVECTDGNGNKLNINVNNQSQLHECHNESTTPNPPICENPADKLWINVSSLVKAVNSNVKDKVIEVVKNVLTPDEFQGFNVKDYNSQGKLLSDLLLFAAKNLTLNPIVENIIKYILDNIRTDGPGAMKPSFICIKRLTETKHPVVCEQPKETICTDADTNVKGIKSIAVKIPSLFVAIKPNAPQEYKDILMSYLSRTDVIRHINSMKWSIYKTRGEVLEEILTYLKSQSKNVSSKINYAIEKIFPFIQKDKLGSLTTEVYVTCQTAAFLPPLSEQHATSEGEAVPIVTTPQSEEHDTTSIYTTIPSTSRTKHSTHAGRNISTERTIIEDTTVSEVSEITTFSTSPKDTTEYSTETSTTTDLGPTDTEELTEVTIQTEFSTVETTETIVTESDTEEYFTSSETSEYIKPMTTTTEISTRPIMRPTKLRSVTTEGIKKETEVLTEYPSVTTPPILNYAFIGSNELVDDLIREITVTTEEPEISTDTETTTYNTYGTTTEQSRDKEIAEILTEETESTSASTQTENSTENERKTEDLETTSTELFSTTETVQFDISTTHQNQIEKLDITEDEKLMTSQDLLSEGLTTTFTNGIKDLTEEPKYATESTGTEMTEAVEIEEGSGSTTEESSEITDTTILADFYTSPSTIDESTSYDSETTENLPTSEATTSEVTTTPSNTEKREESSTEEYSTSESETTTETNFKTETATISTDKTTLDESVTSTQSSSSQFKSTKIIPVKSTMETETTTAGTLNTLVTEPLSEVSSNTDTETTTIPKSTSFSELTEEPSTSEATITTLEDLTESEVPSLFLNSTITETTTPSEITSTEEPNTEETLSSQKVTYTTETEFHPSHTLHDRFSTKLSTFTETTSPKETTFITEDVSTTDLYTEETTLLQSESTIELSTGTKYNSEHLTTTPITPTSSETTISESSSTSLPTLNFEFTDDETLMSETTENDDHTLPTIFDIDIEQNETNILSECEEHQIPLKIPDIYSLLEIVESKVQIHSIEIIRELLENIPTETMVSFYTGEILTKTQMLTRLLTFIKSTYKELEFDILQSINDVIAYAELDEKGLDVAKYTVKCLDNIIQDDSEESLQGSSILSEIANQQFITNETTTSQMTRETEEESSTSHPTRIVETIATGRTTIPTEIITKKSTTIQENKATTEEITTIQRSTSSPYITTQFTTEIMTEQPTTTQEITTEEIMTEGDITIITEITTEEPTTTQEITTEEIMTEEDITIITEIATEEPTTTQEITTEEIMTEEDITIITEIATEEPTTTQENTTEEITTQFTTEITIEEPTTFVTEITTEEPTTTQEITTEEITTQFTTGIMTEGDITIVTESTTEEPTTTQEITTEEITTQFTTGIMTEGDITIVTESTTEEPTTTQEITTEEIATSQRSTSSPYITTKFTTEEPTTTQAIESTTEDMTSTQISTPSSYITTHFTTNEETTQYVTSEVQLSTTLKPSTNQESTTSQSTVLYSTLQPTTTSKGTTTEDATDYEQLTTDSQLTITTSETRTTEERTTSISTTVTQLHTTTLRPTETMVTDRPTTSEFITATEESTLTEQTSDITTLFTSTTSTTNTSSFQTTLLPVTESVGTTEDIKRKPYKPDHLVLSAIESDGTCRDDQTPMVIPDLNSLITAVDHSVSKESLNTVVNYIEKNNLANLMADFNTDIDIDFTKRSKLLGDILKHIKLKHLKDNPTVLHSVDHVLSKLSSEEDEELLPEYYFVCRNNSGTETTTMSQLSPFPSTTVKINKQPRITPEYFPTAATFPQTVTTTESEQIFTATTLSTEPTIETDLMSTTESLISIETEELSTISATTSSAETTTTQKIMSTTTESLNTSESEEISTTLRTTYPVTTTEAEIMDTTTESIISTTESEKMPTSQTTIFSETSTKQNEMSTTTKIKETILSTTTTEHILMSTTISSETPTEHEDILTTTEIEETTLPTTTTEHMLTSTISSETYTEHEDIPTTTEIEETTLPTTTREHILTYTTISSETSTEHDDIPTTTEIEETTLPTTTTEHILTSTTISSTEHEDISTTTEIEKTTPPTTTLGLKITSTTPSAFISTQSEEITETTTESIAMPTSTFIATKNKERSYLPVTTSSINTEQTVMSTAPETSRTTIKSKEKSTEQATSATEKTNTPIIQCPENQISVNIPNIKLLLQVVDNRVSQEKIKMVINLFQERKLLKTLQHFEYSEYNTSADLLHNLLVFIEDNYEGIKPIQVHAINEVLFDIDFSNVQQPEFLQTCMDSTEETVTETPLSEISATTLTEEQSLPSECGETQIVVVVPNTRTLFKAVHSSTSQSSIKTLSIFFQSTNLARLLEGLYTEKFTTRAELLTNMLLHIKETNKNIEPTLLHAINDILSNILQEGEGAVQPDFTITCEDIVEQTHTTSIEDKMTTLIVRPSTTGDSSTYFPGATLTTTLSGEILEYATVTEDTEITTEGTDECSDIQNIVIIPDMDSLLRTVDKNITDDKVKALHKILTSKNTLELFKNFDMYKYNTKGELLKNILMYILQKNKDLNVNQFRSIKEVIEHIDFTGEGTMKPDLKKVCLDAMITGYSTLPAGITQPYQTSIRIPVAILCRNGSDLSEFIIRNIKLSTFFNSLDSSAPEKDKYVISEYLTNSETFEELEKMYFKNQNKEEFAFSPQINKTYGNIFIQILQLIKTRDDLEGGVIQAIDNILSHVNVNKYYLDYQKFCNFSSQSTPIPSTDLPFVVSPTSQQPEWSRKETSEIKTGTTEASIDNALEMNLTDDTNIYITEGEIPEECPEGNSTQILTIDMQSLFHAIDANISERTKENVLRDIDVPEIQNALKVLNWDEYRTKGALLKDILVYLISNDTEIKSDLVEILPHVLTKGPGARQPTFKFVCVPKEHISESQKQENSVLKIHSQDRCPENPLFKSIYVISIPSLLKAIKPTAPLLEKAVIALLLQRENISTLLPKCDMKEYKSSGHLLKILLDHLSTQPDLGVNIVENIQTLICYISLEGLGALPPDIKVECDTELLTPAIMPMIIPTNCSDRISVPTITLNIPSLLEVIDVASVSKNAISTIESVLKKEQVQNHVLHIDTDVNITRGQFLINILEHAKDIVKDKNTNDIIDQVLAHIDLNGAGSLRPIIEFVCNSDNSSYNPCGVSYLGKAIAPHHALKMSKMFQALKPTAPKGAMSTIWKYLGKINFFTKIINFDVLQFKTQGELLKGLLEHLLAHPVKDETVMNAVHDLIKFVRLDGPGREKADLAVICSLTLAPNVPTPLNLYATELDEEGYSGSLHKIPPIEITKECTKKNQLHMYIIDIPSLFHAVNTQIPQIIIKNVVNIIDTVSMQNKLKALDWDKYETKAEFLKDILSYVILHTNQSKEIVDAMKKINLHIDSYGPGASPPNFKFICVPLTPSEFLKYQNEPVIMQSVPGTCKNGSSDQNSTTTLVVNIPSLLKTLKPTTPRFSKAISMAFFQSPNFENIISDFKLGSFKTRGEQFQALLAYLITRGGLEPLALKAIKTLLGNVQLDGPGSLPPDMKIVCHHSRLNNATRNPVELCLHERFPNIMVIPSPDNQTMTGTFMVDFPSLFTAFDSNVPMDKLSLISNTLQKPDLYAELMDFDWYEYGTKGSLLRDVLLLILKMAPEQSEIGDAVDELLPYVLHNGPGSSTPVVKFEYIRGQEMASNRCDEGIKPLYILNINSLLRTLNASASEIDKNIIGSFIGNLDFYKYVRGFNFLQYKTFGELFRELLAYLLTEDTLQPEVFKAASALITNVKLDGCGEDVVHFKIMCNITIPKRLSHNKECIQKCTNNETIQIEETQVVDVEITNKCYDNGTMEITAVDMTQLLYTIDLPNEMLQKLDEIFKRRCVQEKLLTFDWNSDYKNKAKLLKEVLRHLLTTLTPDQEEFVVIEGASSQVAIELDRQDRPSFATVCLTEDTLLKTINQITNGPSIIKPSKGKCDNGATPILAINIATLFKTLKPTTLLLAKSIVSKYLSKPTFHEILGDFKLASFRSPGELLRNLLTHLASHTSENTTLMKAINILLPNIQTQTKSKLLPPVRIICNITLNDLMTTGITLKPTISMPISMEIEPTVLSPCIMSVSGNTYKIDFPNLFYALKQNASQTSLNKIIEYITRPEFYSVLQGFDVESQETKGDLLASLLKFIGEKFKSEEDIGMAIKDIMPYVLHDQHGADPPELQAHCALPTEIPRAMNTAPRTVEGPKLINSNGRECLTVNTNMLKKKGTTIFEIEASSITKIIEAPKPKQNVLNNLLTSENISKYLQVLNLRDYLSKADLLDDILSTMQKNANLSQENTKFIKEMKSLIQREGEGALTPDIVVSCKQNVMNPTPNYITFTTNDTCYFPNDYSTGMSYQLKTDSLLKTFNEKTPPNILSTVTSFFNQHNIHTYLKGFNILRYKTQGQLMRTLLPFLSTQPGIKAEYKKALISSVPFLRIDGPGAEASIIITNCPDELQMEIMMTEKPDPCESSKAIKTTKFGLTVFDALDQTVSNESLGVMVDYLSKDDIMLTKLYKFNVHKYETKGELLQALLASVWSHPQSQTHEKEAAKTLLPHVIFEGPGKQPPDFHLSCYVPNGTLEFNAESGIQPLTLVYPSNKTCDSKIKGAPGIIIHRIEIPSLFEALEPNITQDQHLPVSTFLSKPYAYEYIRGIDIERYNTKGELLRAVLTFLRFKPRYIEPEVKKALMRILPAIRLQDSGELLVDSKIVCSPLNPVHNLHNTNLTQLLISLIDNKISSESDSLRAVINFITSPKFKLMQYLKWVDTEQPITKGEVLKLILLKISDENPTIGKHILPLLSHVQENKGIGREIVTFEFKKFKNASMPFEVDFMQLLHVLKPEANNKSVATVFSLLGKQETLNHLAEFDSNQFKTKGKLLIGILNYLQLKYNLTTDIGKAIAEIIPFVDLDHLGALPPVVKKIYITTNTSVNAFTLDLGTLYNAIPRNNLTIEGKAALDAIFKYLSTEDVDYLELLQDVNSSLPLNVQLKLILIKLRSISDYSLKKYIDVLLPQLEEQLTEILYQDQEPIPDLDWIEVLHAIPDNGVPSEVRDGKKELYYFFLSSAFKTITRDFRINLNYNRAKFLRVLLAHLRIQPEVIRITPVKTAIAYVFMFIKEEGAGLVAVQDDIILPEQQEEALSAQNRIKELLYQIFGLIEQEGAFEILQTLQKLFETGTKLNLETTYLGYDVLEEFPPKERLKTILRRIYHNYIMFLNQDAISAMDMVFISLGETKAQTSQTLQFLPFNIDELQATVLGTTAPVEVRAAADIINMHVNLPTLPLGKAFQDTVPSILNLKPRPRLAVVLRIIWRIYSKQHDAELLTAIKTVYEYIQPHKLENEILTQQHHTAIVAALDGMIRSNAPANVLEAKRVVVEHLKNQKNIYDKALANIVTRNLPPKDLIGHTLRRFREHQHKLQPKLWIAISTIFEYLSIPEHYFTDRDQEENVNIVDEFKQLAEEDDSEVANAKRLLISFLVNKKQEISKIFRGQNVLFQYAPREKMAIILGRLLRIYGEKLEPNIVNAAETILQRLSDSVLTEVDEESIDVFALLDSVVNKNAPNKVIEAKELVKNTLGKNSTKIQHVLNEVIIQDDYNEHRCLAIILRQLFKKYTLEFDQATKDALITLFDYLEVKPDSPADDQFAGNVTFEPLFDKVFPKEEIPDEIAQAKAQILKLLDMKRADIRKILHGIHLWKLPLETQVSLILYRLTKYGGDHSDEVKEAVSLLLNGLDTDLEEVATEDIDESYTPERLFDEALENKNITEEVQEAKGIVTHFLLSGSPMVKDIYRGIDFANISDPTNRLVALLKNILIKRAVLGSKMTEALQVLSDSLNVHLGDVQIDPYTFDFEALFNRVIPSSHSVPEPVQHSKSILLKAIKKRPSVFKKILQDVKAEEYVQDNKLLNRILEAINDYKHQQLSVKIQTAVNLLTNFLNGKSIDDVNQSYLLNSSGEDESGESSEVGVRIFQDESTTKRKNQWKRKKTKPL